MLKASFSTGLFCLCTELSVQFWLICGQSGDRYNRAPAPFAFVDCGWGVKSES